MVQVVKQQPPGQVSIQQRLIQGCAAQIERLIQISQGQGALRLFQKFKWSQNVYGVQRNQLDLGRSDFGMI